MDPRPKQTLNVSLIGLVRKIGDNTLRYLGSNLINGQKFILVGLLKPSKACKMLRQHFRHMFTHMSYPEGIDEFGEARLFTFFNSPEQVFCQFFRYFIQLE